MSRTATRNGYPPSHYRFSASINDAAPRTNIRIHIDHQDNRRAGQLGQDGNKKRGAADLELLKSWIIPVPAGAIVASFVAAYVSGDELKAIFAGIAVAVGLRMLLNRESWRLGSDRCIFKAWRRSSAPARSLLRFVLAGFRGFTPLTAASYTTRNLSSAS